MQKQLSLVTDAATATNELFTTEDSTDRHGYRFDELEPDENTTPRHGHRAIATAYAVLDEVLPAALYGSKSPALPQLAMI